MHVSRSTKPFTNHSWQVWRSIYNNHIDFKISPKVIWVQWTKLCSKCTKPLAQRCKAKQVLRQKLNNVNQTFWFSNFLCDFWIFDMWRKRLIKNKRKPRVCTNKQTHNHQHKQQAIKQTLSQSIGSIRSEERRVGKEC